MTWETSYQKAEVATTPITLTKIEDGLQMNVTAMALLHMVSRFHKDFEKDKDHESDLEEERRLFYVASTRAEKEVGSVDEFKSTLKNISDQKESSVTFFIQRGIHTLFIEIEPDWKNS